MRAERTYTLCRPKPALVTSAAAEHAGLWTRHPDRHPRRAVAPSGSRARVARCGARGLLAPRLPRDAHKGTYGHLLVVAGSRGKSRRRGARVARRAALGGRTGDRGDPAERAAVVAAQQAEIMTEPFPETAPGGIARTAGARVLKLLATRDALAIGPGLGNVAGSGGRGDCDPRPAPVPRRRRRRRPQRPRAAGAAGPCGCARARRRSCSPRIPARPPACSDRRPRRSRPTARRRRAGWPSAPGRSSSSKVIERWSRAPTGPYVSTRPGIPGWRPPAPATSSPE